MKDLNPENNRSYKNKPFSPPRSIITLMLLWFGIYAHAGCDHQQVIVNGKPTFTGSTIHISGNYQIDTMFVNVCTGANATLTNGPGQQYLWYNGLTTDSITVTSATPGTYVYSAFVYISGFSPCGFDSFQYNWIITYLPARPVINLSHSQILPACDTLILNASATTGYPPLTYSWTPNGNTQDSSLPTFNISGIYNPTAYKVTVTDSLGCVKTDSVIVTPELTTPIHTNAAISGCSVLCGTVPNCNYQWYYSDGVNGYTPVSGAIQPLYSADSTGNYYVKVTSSLYPACPSYQSNTVNKNPYQNQQICNVTIDSTNTYNIIVWDKSAGYGIEYFKIYKLSDVTSQYELIGEQSAGVFSTFADTASRHSQSSSSYKISIVDSCNDESLLSPLHKTILLSSNLGTGNTVNLSWNAYEGFTYNNFEIWRGSNGGIMSLLTTVANNTYAYIDNNPPSNPYYQLHITNPNGCTPSRSFDYSTVKSNVVTPAISSGIENITMPDIMIYPNPNNGKFKLSLGQASLISIKVYNNIGALIYHTLSDRNIDILGQPQGNYIALIQTDKGVYKSKLVIK